MTNQTGITSPSTLHRKNDCVTSVEAAYAVNATELEAVVLDAIRSFPNGCIQDDILDYLDGVSTVNSITPRFRPLINKGLVMDSGDRRKGRAGVNQRIMIATDFSYVPQKETSDLDEFMV